MQLVQLKEDGHDAAQKLAMQVFRLNKNDALDGLKL
jgi:hypothetical protein